MLFRLRESRWTHHSVIERLDLLNIIKNPSENCHDGVETGGDRWRQVDWPQLDHGASSADVHDGFRPRSAAQTLQDYQAQSDCVPMLLMQI